MIDHSPRTCMLKKKGEGGGRGGGGGGGVEVTFLDESTQVFDLVLRF